MALASPVSRNQPVGRAKPRIAPPTPARSGAAEFKALASKLGIDLFPWQEVAARYLTALGTGQRWLYREVAIIVARQNGKTTLLIPLIVGRLLAGHRIMHAAQNRELPREVHDAVASLMVEHFPMKLAGRRGIRFGAGQEQIVMRDGGRYRIAAASRGGARGPSNDLVIVDELREMDDHGFIGAAKPTIAASAHPQFVYLSNAGTEQSEVLNAVKARSEADPVLAYLEWSASPERSTDDLVGWLEANPAAGHKAGLMDSLRDEHRAAQLGGTMSVFETEHLCRWVVTMRERLVDEYAWAQCHQADLEAPTRPMMAVSMDPNGRRASAAVAWRRTDGTTGVRLLFDVPGDPIDTDELGKDLRQTAAQLGVRKVGFDPLTDTELAKYFPKSEAIGGQKFVGASSTFVNLVNGGKLRWTDADALTDDLTWTARKANTERASFEAVRAKDDRPIPASLAAIRAVWLVSGPKPPPARIY